MGKPDDIVGDGSIERDRCGEGLQRQQGFGRSHDRERLDGLLFSALLHQFDFDLVGRSAEGNPDKEAIELRVRKRVGT